MQKSRIKRIYRTGAEESEYRRLLSKAGKISGTVVFFIARLFKRLKEVPVESKKDISITEMSFLRAIEDSNSRPSGP